jgi:MFS family permease
MSEKNSICTRKSRDTDSTTDTELCSLKEHENTSQAWLTVLGSFLIYYSSYGLINSFGFFQEYYYEHTALASTSQSTIALVGTMQIALMNCLAPISGALSDSFGIRVCLSFRSLRWAILTVVTVFVHLLRSRHLCVTHCTILLRAG